MGLDAAISALEGSKLPPGVPPSDAAAFNYVESMGRAGQPATARPTANGGYEVVSSGTKPAAELKADEGLLSGAISALQGTTDTRSIVEQIPGIQPEGKQAEEAPWYKRPLNGVVGGLEAGASLATGAVAAPVGAVAGIARNLMGGQFGTTAGSQMAQDRMKEVMESLTYQPRTEAGKGAMEIIGDVASASKLQGLGPAEAVPLASIMAGPKAMPKIGPKVPKATSGSVGAAATEAANTARAAVANTPQLQPIVEELIRKKQPIDLPALDRHVEAQSLPVPVHLTKGQATQDVTALSLEQNSRGKNKPLADLFNEQNKALIANTDAIREKAAPDVFAQTKPEHGELLIDAYKKKDAKLNADISAKYGALKDANGGELPLDVNAFVKSADEKLHKELLFDHVPPAIRSTIDRLQKDGSMTFENFESLRTRLAAIQRSNVDGNVKAAAGVIRDALEDMPMPAGAEHLKPLADQARAAAKARFDLIKKDAAYKAVVEGKASADKFIDKYVIASDQKPLQTMLANLAEDPLAKQVVASGTMNHLKRSAGLIDNTGNFSQAGYNRAVEGIRPKLQDIFGPEERKQVEALGNVARYTQAQPRGAFVNNSNTLVGAVAEAAKNTAEGAANVAAHGVPVGSWARKMSKIAAERKELKETMQTGAGIRLKDVK